jgi:hypothetical protein
MSFVGAAILASGSASGFPFLAFGILMLLAIWFERATYKQEVSAPPPGFEWTGERAIEVDAVVDVWANADTGERVYVRRGGVLG